MIEISYEALILASTLFSLGAVVVAVIALFTNKNQPIEDRLNRVEGRIDNLRTSEPVITSLEQRFQRSAKPIRLSIEAAAELAEVLSRFDIPVVDGVIDAGAELLIEIVDGEPATSKTKKN